MALVAAQQSIKGQQVIVTPYVPARQRKNQNKYVRSPTVPPVPTASTSKPKNDAASLNPFETLSVETDGLFFKHDPKLPAHLPPLKELNTLEDLMKAWRLGQDEIFNLDDDDAVRKERLNIYLNHIKEKKQHLISNQGKKIVSIDLDEDLADVFREYEKNPDETEWLEFKGYPNPVCDITSGPSYSDCIKKTTVKHITFKFLKTILAIRNTPTRKKPGFIVFGVTEPRDGTRHLIGQMHPGVEETHLLDFLDAHIKNFDRNCVSCSWVKCNAISSTLQCMTLDSPGYLLKIKIRELSQDEKRSEVPYWTLKHTITEEEEPSHKAQPNNIYVRKGGSNGMLTHSEYLNELFPKNDIAEWLHEHNMFFNPVEKHLFLCFSHLQQGASSHISQLPYSLIMDFDMHSSTSGINKEICTPYVDTLTLKKDVHTLERGNKHRFWLLMNGTTAKRKRGETVQDWIQEFGVNRNDLFRCFRKIFEAKESVCLVLWEDSDDNVVNKLIESMRTLNTYFPNCQVIYFITRKCTKKQKIISELRLEQHQHLIVDSLQSVLACFSSHFKKYSPDSDQKFLPGKEKKDHALLSAERERYLSEIFEIVHLNSEKENLKFTVTDFLEGKIENVPFHIIAANPAKLVKRSIEDEIYEAIVHCMSALNPSQITIYHQPGTGGTTLGRQLIYRASKYWPCFILTQNDTDMNAFFDRLDCVFKVTKTTSAIILLDKAKLKLDQLLKHSKMESLKQKTILFVKIKRERVSLQKSKEKARKEINRSSFYLPFDYDFHELKHSKMESLKQKTILFVKIKRERVSLQKSKEKARKEINRSSFYLPFDYDFHELKSAIEIFVPHCSSNSRRDFLAMYEDL
eukprot:TRINITY_DN6456_c0_g1_i1.p1 TRINITY_DN6456_c0_g1~~TRINITY_DN6456_c0_g1_i1.p1  ORF type:complete len:856 (-),score=125.42 TRINITY_DN6456_c0_g1_i1:2267-4834(-)